jgi:hypothetical protein
MAVGDRQEIPALSGEPLLASGGLALGAMPIAAGVECGGLSQAVIAPLNVRAEGGGLACADVPEDPKLMVREYVPPSFEKFLFVLAKDIGDFEPMRVHRWRPS